MTIRSFLKAACITIAFSSGSALAGHHEKGEMPSQTIVEVAIGADLQHALEDENLSIFY